MPDDPRFHPVNIINDKDALHSVTWDYKAIKTLDAPTLSDERNLCVNDVRAIAEKYNVGFMVGKFGIFGGNSGELPKYRYTNSTLRAYFEDMTSAFAAEGIGWVIGSETHWSLLQGYPCITGAKYTRLTNSNSYYDKNLAAIFKKINGK